MTISINNELVNKRAKQIKDKVSFKLRNVPVKGVDDLSLSRKNLLWAISLFIGHFSGASIENNKQS